MATTDVIKALRSGAFTSQYKGLVNVKEQGPLVLLNYTDECAYRREWNEVTLFCRGVIIDTRTWTVAAWPFPKFFNINEMPETQVEALPAEPFAVYEKIDGSLGILYRGEDGQPAIASRGSFTSEQAVRGTQMLRNLAHLDELPDSLTLVFEIVYSENPSVLKYDFEGLVLLAIFNRETGEELPWSEVTGWAACLGCHLPKVYQFGSLTEAIASRVALGSDVEGYVVRFASGFRVKLKGDAYLTLHKLVWGLSKKRVFEALVAGSYEDFLRQLPEEFRPGVEMMAEAIREQARDLETEARGLFAEAPKGDRKTFAIWMQSRARPDLKGALFQLLDGREINWYKLVQC